jgi:hypothetical protein
MASIMGDHQTRARAKRGLTKYTVTLCAIRLPDGPASYRAAHTASPSAQCQERQGQGQGANRLDRVTQTARRCGRGRGPPGIIGWLPGSGLGPARHA